MLRTLKRLAIPEKNVKVILIKKTMQSVAVAVLIAMILSLAAVAVSIIAIIDSSGHGGSGLTSTEITEIQNLVTNVQIVDGVVEAKGFSTAFTPPTMLVNASSGADPE